MHYIHPKTKKYCTSLIDVLETCADFQPDTLAFRFLLDKGRNPKSLTYRNLDQRARAIAALLQERKVKKGDRVILLYPPGLELIEAFHGCIYAGAIAVLVYPPANPKLVERLQAIIENAGAKILLSTDDIIKKFRQLKWLKFITHLPLLKHFTQPYFAKQIPFTRWDFEKLTLVTTNDIALETARDWHPVAIAADHLAFLQYTSGSTGIPKGVMISHKNLLHNLSITREAFGLTDESIVVSWLPPYHDMGLIGGILQPLFSGIPCTLMSPFHFLHKPVEWLKAISDFKGIVSGGPNFAYRYCAEKISEPDKEELDLRSWSLAFNGAEPIHAETLEKFYRAFAVCGFKKKAFYCCYGLAEATLFVSGNMPEQGYKVIYVDNDALNKHKVIIVDQHDTHSKSLVSSGYVFQEVRIVNPHTRKECEDFEVGEIWIHSASVAQGYWQLSEATQATFHVHIQGDESHKPYLRTGDLGFIYKDNLYISGRLKDLIIVHGVNHYPQDIEHSVNESHQSIRIGQSAAFSIEMDEEEHLGIVCEVQPDVDEKTYPAIFSAIQRAVAKNNRLSTNIIALLPAKSLPKTTSGKVKRGLCRDSLLDGTLVTLAIWKLAK
ncbi:MAG: fatty acyl-AMP ligase [Gammaproteobacteria bacterium]|nr:fatty acyl-AMP ligase [Gammaproteobacteria bacterium]